MNSFHPSQPQQEFMNSVNVSLNEAHQKLNLILKYLNIFYEKDNNMAYDISALLTAVQNEKTQEASLVKLAQGLSQQIASMAANVMDDNTKAQLADLANQINSSASDMATAVAANTPVAAQVTPVTTNSTHATPTTGSDATTVNPPAADSTVATS